MGAVAVAVVAGVAWSGPGPVQAQLPDLLPTTTTAPGATSTTLLPPLESLTPPPTTAPPGAPAPTLLPGPPADAPPATLLPAPRTSRTTTFTTTPIPPRTPVRTPVTSSAVPRAPTTTSDPVPEELEGGDAEAGFEATLPFTPDDERIQAAGLDVELGGSGSEQQVAMLASVAAGLIAVVLLGVVGWVQAQVRRRADAEVAVHPRW